MSSTLDFAGYIPPYTLMGGRSDDYLFGSSSGSGNDDGIPGGGACPLCPIHAIREQRHSAAEGSSKSLADTDTGMSTLSMPNSALHSPSPDAGPSTTSAGIQPHQLRLSPTFPSDPNGLSRSYMNGAAGAGGRTPGSAGGARFSGGRLEMGSLSVDVNANGGVNGNANGKSSSSGIHSQSQAQGPSSAGAGPSSSSSGAASAPHGTTGRFGRTGQPPPDRSKLSTPLFGLAGSVCI